MAGRRGDTTPGRFPLQPAHAAVDNELVPEYERRVGRRQKHHRVGDFLSSTEALNRHAVGDPAR